MKNLNTTWVLLHSIFFYPGKKISFYCKELDKNMNSISPRVHFLLEVDLVRAVAIDGRSKALFLTDKGADIAEALNLFFQKLSLVDNDLLLVNDERGLQ